MNVLALVWKEILFRRWSSLGTLFAVVVAAGLPVAFFTAGEASQRETTRLMRDMGYNLRIIPADTDMGRFWADGYSQTTLPAEAVQRFSSRGDLLYRHLIALLQRRVEWGGTSVLLTGIDQELSPVGRENNSMLFLVEPGTAVVGHEPARALGLERGATIELLGRTLTIASVMGETGSEDDVRLYVNLADAQAMLDLPDRINEIKALECYCASPEVDTREELRAQLMSIVPEGMVLRLEAIAEGREKQRRMMERYFGLVLPVVLIACGAWIALLAALNVRERGHEIGVLRALGHGSERIAVLFLGRAVLLGILGAAIGFGLGACFAVQFGPNVFLATAKAIAVDWTLLWYALVGAPLFAAVAAFVPTCLAVTRDPAVILRSGE